VAKGKTMNKKPENILTDWLSFGISGHQWRRVGRFMEISHPERDIPEVPIGFFGLKLFNTVPSSKKGWDISTMEVPGWVADVALAKTRSFMESCYVQIFPKYSEPVVDTHSQLIKWTEKEVEVMLFYPTSTLDVWVQLKNQDIKPKAISQINNDSLSEKMHFSKPIDGGHAFYIDTNDLPVGDKIKITFNADFDFVRIDFKDKPAIISESKPQSNITTTTFTMENGVIITLPKGYVVDFDKLNQAFVLGGGK
jgi:hypothetical protein